MINEKLETKFREIIYKDDIKKVEVGDRVRVPSKEIGEVVEISEERTVIVSPFEFPGQEKRELQSITYVYGRRAFSQSRLALDSCRTIKKDSEEFERYKYLFDLQGQGSS